MIVYFLRHADAEDFAYNDFDRKLTAKGIDQAERMGKFCAARGIMPDIIISSPYLRARETAEIVGRHIGVQPVLHEWIGCGMRPETFFGKLIGFKRSQSVMVVGHEPDLGYTITQFLGLNDASVFNIRKATLTAIEAFSPEAGAGTLDFCIPARLV